VFSKIGGKGGRKKQVIILECTHVTKVSIQVEYVFSGRKMNKNIFVEVSQNPRRRDIGLEFAGRGLCSLFTTESSVLDGALFGWLAQPVATQLFNACARQLFVY
jgi:hypothetical protein